MEFIIIEKWLWYKNQAIAGFKKGYDRQKGIEMYLKYCRQSIKKCRQMTDEEILVDMVEKKVAKPSTFPKFSNEKEFKLKWDGGYILNPKIINIRWDNKWEYELENIGHKYSFQNESLLSNIN